ncbi:MAG: hypothetical protein AAF682_05595 [Planctomycetota bacterium]
MESRLSFETLALGALCLALSAMSAALAVHARGLSRRIDELTAQVQAAERKPLPEGERVPALDARDAAGERVTLPGEDGRATLLLVSSDACDYCEDVRPLWSQWATAAEGSALRVVELVLDGQSASLDARSTPYPRFAAPAGGGPLLERLPGVPAVLLLDAAGRLRAARYGSEQADLTALVQEHL